MAAFCRASSDTRPDLATALIAAIVTVACPGLPARRQLDAVIDNVPHSMHQRSTSIGLCLSTCTSRPSSTSPCPAWASARTARAGGVDRHDGNPRAPPGRRRSVLDGLGGSARPRRGIFRGRGFREPAATMRIRRSGSEAVDHVAARRTVELRGRRRPCTARPAGAAQPLRPRPLAASAAQPRGERLHMALGVGNEPAHFASGGCCDRIRKSARRSAPCGC